MAPILAEHCMGCHQDGGIAPFSLVTFDDAVERAGQLVAAIDEGIVPPFSVEPGEDCAPSSGWQDDPRLSAGERATLQAWIDDGRPVGELATIAPPQPPALEGVTHSLTPAPFTTEGTSDQFICFLLDPQTATDTF